jgi:hypothetical protein
MAGGVLLFSDYLSGPDNLQLEQVFPSTQRTLQYNFGVNVTGWTFHADYQTLVVNPITFSRDGEPNFSTSEVIGYFSGGVISTSSYIQVITTSTGRVNITIPKSLYTGPILPDARQNVPVLIVGVTWTDAGTPAQVNTHRWAFLQCYEPGVAPTDPTAAAGYTAIT